MGLTGRGELKRNGSAIRNAPRSATVTPVAHTSEPGSPPKQPRRFAFRNGDSAGRRYCIGKRGATKCGEARSSTPAVAAGFADDWGVGGWKGCGVANGD